ncbi:MAG: hypothetical protein K1X83_07885 [Oligoflexia bacterium]|nr:hypothetical protein [Oligoflexia bacterium]
MNSDGAIWGVVKAVAEAQGFRLFDLDLPSSARSVLRVFITRDGAATVTLDDCAALSRKLEHTPGFEDLLPERCVLEVSSPGINRRLRLPEHFSAAVGERVKLTIEGSSPSAAIIKGGVLTGVLKNFDGTNLTVGVEEALHEVAVPLTDVARARVDFLF